MSTKPFKKDLIINDKTYSVDVGIEIPPRSLKNRDVIELALRMKHGESKWFPSIGKAGTLIKAMRKNKIEFESRKEGSGYRVWKIDPKDEN